MDKDLKKYFDNKCNEICAGNDSNFALLVALITAATILILLT